VSFEQRGESRLHPNKRHSIGDRRVPRCREGRIWGRGDYIKNKRGTIYPKFEFTPTKPGRKTRRKSKLRKKVKKKEIKKRERRTATLDWYLAFWGSGSMISRDSSNIAPFKRSLRWAGEKGVVFWGRSLTKNKGRETEGRLSRRRVEKEEKK